ncbi:MAG: hypothetical protein HY975_03675 [Candidatus Kerfeldbacteria bacterium]|nr:hypothetical protein [Candidatus Kerfeldbacteria bacterium]
MAIAETMKSDASPLRQSRLGAVSLVILTILIALAYAFNVAVIEDVKSRFPDVTMTAMAGLAWSLLFSVIGGAIVIALTKVITMGRDLSWRSLITFYLLASGWHVVGGLYAVYLWQSGGWPEPGGTVLLGLNLFEWDGRIGHWLQHVSIDELLHLVTYTALVCHLARWRKAWWLYTVLLAPWLVYTWITSSLSL